jgi:hypothetical protein
MPEQLIHLSDDVALPLDIVTESNAILGKKGSGKTSAAIVLLEEMFRAGVPVVSIDPKGDHYGIRSSADGTAEGLPIPVFGGLHGDIPLEPTAGAVIADLVLERRLSCVLDVSEFSRADVRRFLLAFGDRLYRKAKREPMHLFLEECHEYLPQQVRAEDAQLVGAWQRVVKMGRFKGVGVTLLSQRSAAVNKDVLEQVDNLFVMRTTGPRDRDAIKGWIETHADAKGILASLPTMASGECWLWQPGRGEPVNFRFRMRDTYDAGSTPKIGEKPRPPATLADVDLSAISTAMADTIEKAKADDPKELRARVTKLEAELQAARRVAAPAPVVVEKEVIVERNVGGLTRKQKAAWDSLTRTVAAFSAALEGTSPAETSAPGPDRSAPAPAPVTERPRPAPSGLSKAQRAILTVLAQRGTQTAQQVATLSGYSAKGGGFSNALSGLRTGGFITGGRTDLAATPEGLSALGAFESLPTGQDLVAYWLGRSSKAEALILEQLIAAWPNTLTRDEIAERTGYAANGGGFNNSLSRLRTLQLISGGRDGMRVDDELGTAGAE